MANYPSGPVTFPARSDGQTIFAQHVQILQDEVAAIEAGLLGGLQHNLWGAQGFTLSGVLTPPPIGTNQNDYAPAGLSVAAVVRQQLSAACQLTGLLAQGSGRIITLVVFGMAVAPANVLTIKNQSASSAATNMILCPGAVDLAIAMGGSVTLWYDTANSFWRVVAYANPPAAAAGVTYIGAKVYNRTATQALTAGTFGSLTFPTAEFNSGPMWSAGAPTRLTVPAGQGGHYMVYGKSSVNIAGQLNLRILKNGAVASMTVVPATSSGTAGLPGVLDQTILALNAGDYVEIQAMSAVTNNVGGTTADTGSEFGAYRLNPV